MVRIVDGGPLAAHAMIYGETNHATRQFFESQRGSSLSMLANHAKAMVPEMAKQFGYLALDSTKRMIQDVRRNINWAYHGDVIRSLLNEDSLQMASPRMQRVIMAEPTVRKMWQTGQLEGYGEEYVDLQPGARGEDTIEYQRVMQGIGVYDENDPDGGWVSTMWSDADAEEDIDAMSFDQQLDCQETWAVVRGCIRKRRQDPTSKYGATLM